MSIAEGRLSEQALGECVTELRAACRRPIDEQALATLLDSLRPNFVRILDRPEGPAVWNAYRLQMHDNGRHLGALADYFAYYADVRIVSSPELTQAYTMVRSACQVGFEPPFVTATESSSEKYPRPAPSPDIC